jgi:hypothetical protein
MKQCLSEITTLNLSEGEEGKKPICPVVELATDAFNQRAQQIGFVLFPLSA